MNAECGMLNKTIIDKKVFHVSVLFLGPARDWVGMSTIDLELPPGTTVVDFKRKLADRVPHLEKVMAAIRVAVNQSFAQDEDVLHGGDEIAIIPPVSGG